MLDLIALLEASPSEARSLLKKHRNEPGLSRAYCARIVELFGSDTGKAIQLGSLWKAVQTYGDEPALALRARGIYERLRGRWTSSADAFIAAGNAAPDPVERLSFQVGAVDSLARGGKMAQALQLGEHLAEQLDRLHEKGLAARVRLNLGNALFWQDRMEEARGYLSAAVQPLKEGGYPVESASARMGLSTTHLYGGSLREAERHGRQALEEAREQGFEYLADLCDINLAHVELLSGRPESALDRLLRLKDRLEDAPVDLTRTLEFLGDAYFRLNLWPEAADAYREALDRPETLIALHHAHLQLGLGQALLAAGRQPEAIEQIRRARTRYARLKNSAWTAAATTVHAQALAKADPSRARKLAIQAAHLAETSGASFHAVEAYLTACSLQTDPTSLERAQHLVKREGYLGLLWKVHHLQAIASPDGRRLPHFRRMFEAIQTGRLQTSSIGSRASYLRDKSEAVQSYLAELLRKPTRSNIGEAVRVIEQTRSATLLDELLSAREQSLPSEALQRLTDLREELRELGGEDEPAGPARRATGTSTPLASIQRRWLDLTRDVRAGVSSVVPQPKTDSVIFAHTQDSIFAIAQSRPHRLTVTRADLDKSLKWLQFEILAPMADRDADPSEAERILKTLSRDLVAPWLDANPEAAICPDGPLWRIPWTACVAMLDDAKTTELRLHPSLGGNTAQKIQNEPKVVLWTSNAPDLPHASAEAKQFLENFPDALVCATADEARASMEGSVDLLHVVAHAKHRASNPMFSAILFPDGPVFATEIARSRIRPGLVTLSACETGTMSLVSRDEPDGLARGFLARGARNVVASLWPLDDEAASRMFGQFYRALGSGATVAESLAIARRSAKEWRKHPYFWGPLALYGGYAE